MRNRKVKYLFIQIGVVRIMSKIQDGFFRNKVPFVPISQVVAKDKEISLKAKGLYLLIQSYITIPNFKLYKSYLMSVCVEGQCSFDSAWNELKEKGYLKIYKIAKSDSKGFYYEYELLDAAEPDTPALIVIRKDGTIVEKDKKTTIIQQKQLNNQKKLQMKVFLLFLSIPKKKKIKRKILKIAIKNRMIIRLQ